MKLLRGTLVLLVVSLIFSGTIVFSSNHGFTGVTLPSLSGTYNSPDIVKSNSTLQKVKKISATSNLTGGEVAVEGRVGLKSGTSSYLYSSWTTLPKGSWTTIEDSEGTGTYRLQLRAAKSFVNKCTFYGNWQYE